MSPVLASTSRTHSPVMCTTTNRMSSYLSRTASSTRLILFQTYLFIFSAVLFYKIVKISIGMHFCKSVLVSVVVCLGRIFLSCLVESIFLAKRI